MKKNVLYILVIASFLIFQSNLNQVFCKGLKNSGKVPLLGSVATAKADTGEWRQLFNGKDLTGWKQAGPGSHYVEEGMIKSHGGMGLLYWAGEKIGNCRIRVVFRMRDTLDNSGVFIRVPIEPREEWMPIHYG